MAISIDFFRHDNYLSKSVLDISSSQYIDERKLTSTNRFDLFHADELQSPIEFILLETNKKRTIIN